MRRFQTLLRDLPTIARNRVQPKRSPLEAPYDIVTTPTPLQQRALDLLKVSIDMQPEAVRPPAVQLPAAEWDPSLNAEELRAGGRPGITGRRASSAGPAQGRSQDPRHRDDGPARPRAGVSAASGGFPLLAAFGADGGGLRGRFDGGFGGGGQNDLEDGA